VISMTLSWKSAFAVAALLIFVGVTFVAAPVHAYTEDNPPYSAIINSNPTNGYCDYDYAEWYECVIGDISNGYIYPQANATSTTFLQDFGPVAYLLFQGPGVTTTSSTIDVSDAMAFKGDVSSSSSEADGTFYDYLAYQWVSCVDSPCTTTTVTDKILIWDAIMDGSGVITSSTTFECGVDGCSYAWDPTVHSSWENEYDDGAGSYTGASAVVDCDITCYGGTGISNFATGSYYTYVTAIAISPGI
jgi:hypothetical protein